MKPMQEENVLRSYIQPRSFYAYLADDTGRRWVTRLDSTVTTTTMASTLRELRAFAFHLGYTHIKLTSDDEPTQLIRLAPTPFLQRRSAELEALYRNRPAGEPSRRERELNVPALRERWLLNSDAGLMECWVTSHQAAYRLGKETPLDIERLELVPGWSWTEPPAEPCLIPIRSLGGIMWDFLDRAVFSELYRRLYHAGKLPQGLVDQLEKTPGWSWGKSPFGPKLVN
jgi:hypothetical protein